MTTRDENGGETAITTQNDDALSQPRGQGWSTVSRTLRSRRIDHSKTAIEDARQQLDEQLLSQARQLGFEAIGVTQERGTFLLRRPTLHFVDESGRVHLTVATNQEMNLGQTSYRMRAYLSDGHTIAMEPESLLGRDSTSRDHPVFPQSPALRDNYRYIREVIDHQTAADGISVETIDDLPTAVARTDRYELTDAPSNLLRRQCFFALGHFVTLSAIAILLFPLVLFVAIL